MAKKIRTIESLNDMTITGRLVADPIVNEAGTRATFRLIHNFGGEKSPVTILFVVLARAGKTIAEETLALLKKGNKVLVSAYETPDNYTNKEGKTIARTEYIVKSVEPADKELSVNDVTLSGRLVADPAVNEAGTRAVVRIAHNMGKAVGTLYRDFVFFDKKGELPAVKKGEPVVIKAFINPNNDTRDPENIVYRTQLVAKSIDAAVVVEKTVEDGEAAAAAAEDKAVETAIDLGIEIEA